MSENVTLQSETVQETMLIPLWGRATYSCLYPELLDDSRCKEIIKNVRHDFTQIARSMGEYGGIAYLVRGRRFDDAILAYIAEHPQATVVNLGAGLDTTFSRVDNGQIRWYDIDLPDAIAFRQRYIPDTERSTCLALSAFDHSWFDDIFFDPEKGIFILAGGLFMYFGEEEVRNLLLAMVERFPGGEIIFDALSSMGRRFINRKLKITGAPKMHFVLDHPARQLGAWSSKFELLDSYTFWHGVRRDARWRKITVLMMNVCDLFGTGLFVHIRFSL